MYVLLILCTYINCSTGKPTAPTNVTFPTENTTDISFVVQWGAVTDQFVDSYQVVWIDYSNTQDAYVNETSCTIVGLTPNTTYTVNVLAHNKCGNGNASFPKAITTNVSLIMDTSLTTIISDILNPTTSSGITTASITTTSFTTASIITASVITAGITTASITTASITTALSKPAVMIADTTVSTVYSGSPTSRVEAESNSKFYIRQPWCNIVK